MEKTNNLVIQTKNLKIRIDSNDTLINYGNLDIYEGDFVVLEGKNGSGKSTFLKFLNDDGGDYCSKVGGEAFINGKEIGDYKTEQLRRQIVNINQEDLFIRNESTYHALMRPAINALYDLENKMERKKQIKKWALDFYKDYLVGFFHKDKKEIDKYKNNPKTDLKFMYLCPVTRLSGGQQKMIHILQGIIKAKAINGNIILMDEPLNNLDVENKNKLRDLIKNLRENNPNIAIIMITHCRVFPNINKVIEIKEDGNEHIARIVEFDGYYYDCLERR